MGVKYYLIDEERRELFILGRGDWDNVFKYVPMTMVEAVSAFVEDVRQRKYEFSPKQLAAFLCEREHVQLTSDAGEGSRGPIPYKICGSCYAHDYEPDHHHSVGKTMNLWFLDDERDGWKFPKPSKHQCPACGKMTRDTTAGCDHCDLEDK